MDDKKYILNSKNFIIYKFFNSLFMGTSIGSIFIIYTPLEPSVYSIGGIILAVGMILIATQYAKILNTNYFYKISLFVELVILLVILSFLYFSYSYQIALCVYIGYQITFIFGSYLGRGETLLLKKESLLKSVDISKQSGYLAGLLFSYVFYQILEQEYPTKDSQSQVYILHYILFFIELYVIFFLIRSFKLNKEIS